MNWKIRLLVPCLSLTCLMTCTIAYSEESEQLKALVLTGQSNHGWSVSSSHIQHVLEANGLFSVEVTTAPPKGADMSHFSPEFKPFDVVVLEYNGDPWQELVQRSFEEYMQLGGGLVISHAATQNFPHWPAFNTMIGIGGWGGRDENAGPYVKYRNGSVVLDDRPGVAGACVDPHEFQVVTRVADHPIMRGLPSRWLHAKDELYSDLRGPAKNMTILATAYSDPQRSAHWGVRTTGTGEHEPMAYTVRYGEGRIFGTPMGHVDGGAQPGSGPWPAIECVGYTTLMQRGAEWAATGRVTQEVPVNFPAEAAVPERGER